MMLLPVGHLMHFFLLFFDILAVVHELYLDFIGCNILYFDLIDCY